MVCMVGTDNLPISKTHIQSASYLPGAEVIFTEKLQKQSLVAEYSCCNINKDSLHYNKTPCFQ